MLCGPILHDRDLHGNFPAVLPRFPAENPAVKGTECEGYPREGKQILREPAGEGNVVEGFPRERARLLRLKGG